MTRLALAGAALALAACAGGEPTSVQARLPGSTRPYAEPTVEFSIFQWRVPYDSVATASTTEYGTRFYTTMPGRAVGFRVYRVAGVTGPITFVLRASSGKVVATGSVGADAATGWKNAALVPANPPATALVPGAYYRVSAKLGTAVGRTPGLFASGPIVNKMLVADRGFVRVGNGLPTDSYDAYFVDVLFEPEPD